jgi:tripartite-type tricarboxylate transporter receptor subunit TctC
MKFRLERQIRLAAFTVFFSLIGNTGLIHAQKLRVAYTAFAGTFTILWLGHDAGLYKKHGADMELLFIGSSTTAVQALLAGDVDFTIAFPSVIEAQGDKVRALAVGGDKSVLAGVPTFKELGYRSTGLEMERIVLGPRRMPEERKQILRDAFAKMNNDTTYKNLMKKLGENTVLMQGPEYEKLRARQNVEYKALVGKLTGK